MPEQPELEWVCGAVPRSVQFKDTYYSTQGGQRETRYVFVDGNGLPERWQCGRRFTVAELGFGAGLNFFETARLFEQTMHSTENRLDYVSFELLPLSVGQMAKALSPWPELSGFAGPWLSGWSVADGWNSIRRGNVDLTLAVGPAASMLPQWRGRAHAWYLDGFNPATNGEMWEEALMRQVFGNTLPQGTFATYTAAGWVRRNLEESGFMVKRLPGFAGKREMLIGVKSDR